MIVKYCTTLISTWFRFFRRYVLFKRHYDKYVDLAEKYKEAKNITYYLEERYHEIKVCRNVFVW